MKFQRPAIFAAITGGLLSTGSIALAERGAGSSSVGVGVGGVDAAGVDAAEGGPRSAISAWQTLFGGLPDAELPIWLDALARSPEWTRLDRFATSPTGIGLLLGLAATAVGVLVLLRRRRGAGQLALRLELSDRVDGDFEVALRRRSRRGARAARPLLRLGAGRPRASLRRAGVQRETQFDGLAPGRWFITVDGVLRAPRSRAELAAVAEEVEVWVERDVCKTVDLPLPAVEAPVEIRVVWDRQPARDVGLCLRGRPETLRRARQGRTRTRLARGRHRFLIGAGDRVIEHEIQVEDYEPQCVRVDLARSEGLVFKGCPPAVSSFLRGDLGHAARALERDGQAVVAHLLLAQLHQEQGQTERAAEQLESAGRLRAAADLRRALSDFARAASLYEQAGELSLAAEMYEDAEAWGDAARSHAAVERWDRAAGCFERAGDVEGQLGALEAGGELIRAAALASEHGDQARAIRLLQRVAPGHPDHGRAIELLALAYEQEGHLDLAARQLEARLASLAPDESAPQLELHWAELLAESGEAARALAVLEALREREPTFPGVATRIETLRKTLSMPSPARSGAASGPATGPAASLPPGATAFVARDRYEILEQIGRGGMGLVFRAHDRRLGRDVALKRMPESLQAYSGALSLFLGEAQAAARMNHPNIVTLYDADQEDGRFFITMELLDGLPLDALLARRGRFGPRDTARLGLQVCQGLRYAHQQGIVHRDIKTANLFITQERKLKIMDFGLARMMEAVRQPGGMLIAGTPFYMAPEQSAGARVDARTDLYALGVTLYELSTGALPFPGPDVAEQHRSAPPPDPAAGIPGYPEALARLVLQLLAKSPEDRPASAEEVARALETIVDGAGPASAPTPARS